MASVLLGIGSNLGDRQQTLDRALALVAHLPQTKIIARSRWHVTQPIGGPPDQGDFLNGAVRLETSLSPGELHRRIKELERQCGRGPGERWAARTLDFDLLLYDAEVLATDELTVPHPRMALRRFVLAPAAEVAAEMMHPVLRRSVGQMLEHLDQSLPYVAITGLAAGAAEDAARSLAAQESSRLLEDSAASLPERAERLINSTHCRSELELLAARAALLALAAWPNSDLTTVSPFWWHESLALDECCGTVRQQRELVEHAARLESSIVTPRLLVVLDPPLIETPELGLVHGQGVAHNERYALVREKLLALARSYGACPMLHITSGDPVAVLAEISAAVTAMR